MRVTRCLKLLSGIALLTLGFPDLQAALSSGPPFSATHPSPLPSLAGRSALTDDSESKAQTLALYAEALRVEDKKGLEAALPLYRKVIALDPAFIEVQLKIASALLQSNHLPECLEHLNTALQSNPHSLELRSALASAYVLNKEDARAASISEQILAENPEQLGAIQVLLDLNERNGKSVENDKLIAKLLARPSSNAKFWAGLGQTYSQHLANKAKLGSDEIVRRVQPLFEKAVACPQPPAEAFVGLADCWLLRNKPDQALAPLKKANELQENSPSILVKIGQIEAQLGHKDPAIAALHKAYKLNPAYPQLREILASVYLDKGDDQKAADLLEECLHESPTKLTLYAELGKIYGRLNQLDKAEFYLLQSINFKPSSPEYHIRLALVQLDRNKAPEAAETLAKAHQLFPTSSLVVYYQGLAARSRKQYDLAIEKFLEARRLCQLDQPNLINAEYFLNLALAQDLASKPDDAKKSLAEALVVEPDPVETWTRVALAHAQAKRFALAQDIVKSARAKFPKNPRVALSAAIALRLNQQYADALAQMAEAKKLAEAGDPPFLNAEFYLEWGTICDVAKKGPEAEEAYAEGLKQSPNHPNLLNSLAYSLSLRGVQLERAEQLSKRSLEQEPNSPAFLDTLGWIYFKMGRIADAKALIEKAALSIQNDPEVMSHLAEIALQENKPSEALTLWRKVLVVDPENASAKEHLSSLEKQALKDKPESPKKS
jgi:tetratricopeptide (TPR) repeat protein